MGFPDEILKQGLDLSLVSNGKDLLAELLPLAGEK